MAGKYNPTVVGTDAFFREICIGDEIQDLDGRHYTVDKYGRCKPLDGGNTVPLSSVKEAALVSRYEGPPIDVTERRPDPQPEKKTVIEVPAQPRPVKLTLIERPDLAVDPDKPEKRIPGKKNKSGIVQITAITRTLGIKRTRGLTDFLHQNGIETTFVPKRNKVCIKIEDRDRVTELARQWAEIEPKPEAQAPKPAAPQKKSRTQPGEVKLVTPSDPPISSEALELIRHAETIRGAKLIGSGERGAMLLRDAPDHALAAELRSRGYVVTAIKHVEL